MKRGCFITLEGMEGCGKSTQIRLLAQALEASSYPVKITRSPGGTPAAERIRTILKQGVEGENLLPETELLLFGACHAQMTSRLVLPELEKGTILISDRFYDSTTAYQGYARKMDLDLVRSINSFACKSVKPDLTLILDLAPEEGVRRSRKRGGAELDRFDSEKMEFHHAVRNAFLDMAQKEPDRFCVIDASRSEEEVHKAIMEAVYAGLEKLR